MDCQRFDHINSQGEKIYKPKRSFLKFEDAYKFAQYLNKKENQIHKAEAYKCKKCLKFHVGRTKKELEIKKEQEKKKFRLFVRQINLKGFLSEGDVTIFGKILEISKDKKTVTFESLDTMPARDIFSYEFILKEINPLGDKFTDFYYETLNGKLKEIVISEKEAVDLGCTIYDEEKTLS